MPSLRSIQWETCFEREIRWSALEELQQSRIRAVQGHTQKAFLLISEPLPTFTAGRSATPSDLIWKDERLSYHGTDVHTVARGGKWTFHGPGQVVVYPIVSLPSLGLAKRAVVPFLGTLREGIFEFLASVGVSAEAESGNQPFGVYARGRKLVSFGVSLRGGICSHGLALYLKNQSQYFAGIHPCGVPGAEITSLEELGVDLDWKNASSQVAKFIKKSFQATRT